MVQLVAPFAPEGKKGRPQFFVKTMLLVHLMQQWFMLSDPATEEALYYTRCSAIRSPGLGEPQP
jgi:IS5 family transposase